MANRDPKTPVTFDLTDDDHVDLIPWEFVVYKFETILRDVISNIGLINQDLKRIDDKVVTWLEENDNNNNG